jgi:hypothetical protein
MATTLKDLKKAVDQIAQMVDGKGKSFDDIKVHFKTFDERFEENADEFQEPDTITKVEMDIQNWDNVTITIERKVKHENAQEIS